MNLKRIKIEGELKVLNITIRRRMLATHILTHIFQHSLWLVKIHMGPTKSCGSHIHLVGPMWILTNQRECVDKCVLECVLLAFLLIEWTTLAASGE